MAKTLWSFGHSECNRVNNPFGYHGEFCICGARCIRSCNAFKKILLIIVITMLLLFSAVCIPGHHFNSRGVCVPCPRGFYKDNIPMFQFDQCKACDNGATTLGTGTVSKDECNIRKCCKRFS